MSRRCATKPRQGTGSPTSIGDPVHEKATASTVAPTSVHSGCPLRRAGPPRTLQASVAERHVETEVIHCVGGVLSPLLLNVALHGLEVAAGVRYEASDPARTKRGSPALALHADDMYA